MRYVQRVFEAFGLGVTDFHPHPIAPDGDHLSKLGNRELVFRVIYCVFPVPKLTRRLRR